MKRKSWRGGGGVGWEEKLADISRGGVGCMLEKHYSQQSVIAGEARERGRVRIVGSQRLMFDARGQ